MKIGRALISLFYTHCFPLYTPIPRFIPKIASSENRSCRGSYFLTFCIDNVMDCFAEKGSQEQF